MDYTRKEADGQLAFAQSTEFLRIPSFLYGFSNTNTSIKTSKSERDVFCFEGTLDASEENTRCSCGAKMHVNNHPQITLRHLPFGSTLSCVTFSRNQYVCPKCKATKMQFISFKAPKHRITEELYQYAREERPVHKGSRLFKTDDIVRKEGYEDRYNALIQENQLIFTLDLIKEKLALAYSRKDETLMAEDIIGIMDMCKATGNSHFLWFERLLNNHFEGIIAHATYDISAGKIEGINNKIKTPRRRAYGYPDDEYFFLKLFDMSRRDYVRNPKSHKICD